MSEAVMAPEAYQEPSLKRQVLLTDYAQGRMTIEELIDRMSEIQPPKQPITAKRRFGLFFATILAALVLPPWQRPQD